MPVRQKRREVRKLLVIDRDTQLLASYRDLLVPYGFQVLMASDGEEAAIIVETNPDIMLVILDVAMHRVDGQEWIRWFRTLRADSPLIVISAHRLTADDELCRPSAVLQKPFHVAELLDLVGLFCGLGTPVGVHGI